MSRDVAGVLLRLLVIVILLGCDVLDEPPTRPGTGAVSIEPTATLAPPPPVATTAQVQATPGPSSPAPVQASATPLSMPATTVAAKPAVKPRAAASGYRRFTSSQLPYAIDYLESWRPVVGGVRVEGAPADLFTGDQPAEVRSSVTVVSMPIPAGSSLDLVFEASLAELAEAGLRPSDQIERTVSGGEALIVSYPLERNGAKYAVTQALVAQNTRAWVLTLTAAPGEAERMGAVFNHMLDSFQAW